uniref:Uncharacterized protein n=1 Tax=Arundo donax TaxID=35708 RepID=A0A0A9GCG6_ARUDO
MKIVTSKYSNLFFLFILLSMSTKIVHNSRMLEVLSAVGVPLSNKRNDLLPSTVLLGYTIATSITRDIYH